ncbi:MAG: cytochrome c biogenesis protein [Porticoccaceae bacterium]|nr:MAG: cytochrome c biogenesis protein [Porticoccaceae bacterium]
MAALLRLWLPLLAGLGAALAAAALEGPRPLPGAAQAHEFLPVQEAYRLEARREGERLLLHWRIAPGYYLYKDRFAAALEEGNAPLSLEMPPGVERFDEYYGRTLQVYYGEVTLSGRLPDRARGRVRVLSQGCADAGLCYPPRAQWVTLATTDGPLPVAEADPTPPPNAAHTTLAAALVLAFAGGLILNLMPCVFPILSIKVLSLGSGKLGGARRHAHGLAWTAGVVVSFLVVAAVLLALRAAGASLGWGFQLQAPGFVAALIYLFFLLGLAFSGFWAPLARLAGIGQSWAGGEGLGNSFAAGVLATLVASPCSAPFMGTALGYALTQPAGTALAVFAALGAGMAFPLLALTWMPGLLNKLPRPGPWMVTLKELLAFPLYLTCVWLAWILGNQAGNGAVAAVGAGLVAIAFALWVGRQRGLLARVAAAAGLVAALALPAAALREGGDPPHFEPYSAERLEALLVEGRAVFVNATADWCLSCLANERTVLDSDAFKRLLAEKGITYLKADWTGGDPEVTALLEAHGRSGVPLYLFFPAGSRTPVVLPQILTPWTVRETLTRPRAAAP